MSVKGVPVGGGRVVHQGVGVVGSRVVEVKGWGLWVVEI